MLHFTSSAAILFTSRSEFLASYTLWFTHLANCSSVRAVLTEPIWSSKASSSWKRKSKERQITCQELNISFSQAPRIFNSNNNNGANMLKVIPHMTYCRYPISYLRAHRANQGHLRADLFLAPAVAAIFYSEYISVQKLVKGEKKWTSDKRTNLISQFIIMFNPIQC